MRASMSRPAIKYCAALNWLFGLAGLGLFAGQAQAQYDPGWTKNFRIGALTALGVKGSLSLRGQFAISGSNPGAAGVSGVNHVYDDGYVRVDDTGNAQGYTSNWGYENASQYNAGSQTLLMHSTSSFSAAGGGNADNEFTLGLDLAYGNNLRQWGRTRLGWEFGFGFLPITLKERGAISAIVNRSTFSFDTGAVVIPEAPYNGGASGVGVTIHDVATQVSDDFVPGTLLGTRTFEANLFTFRLGPTLFYDLNPHIGLSGGFGPALGVATESYTYNESIVFSDGTSAPNRGSFNGTDLVYGGYVNFVATYHADENGDVYIGVQYMPMTGSTLSKNGREARLELGGQLYFSLGVNWIF